LLEGFLPVGDKKKMVRKLFFEELKVVLRPRSKRYFAIICIFAMMVGWSLVTTPAVMDYDSRYAREEIGYEWKRTSETIYERANSYVEVLTMSGIDYPISWNITVSANVSVYTANNYFDGLTYNGTGGSYGQENVTLIRIAIFLNGTNTAIIEVCTRKMNYVWFTVETVTIEWWRVLVHLSYFIKGLVFAFIAIYAYRVVVESPISDDKIVIGRGGANK
jgi:hypothetical protein